MIFLRNLLTAATLALPVVAQISPSQVIQDLRALTSESQYLATVASSINSPPSNDNNTFATTISRLNTLEVHTSATSVRFRTLRPVTVPSVADNIFVTFRQFITVQQSLLGVLTNRAQYLAEAPDVAQSVLNVLRRLQSDINLIGLILTTNVEYREYDLRTQLNYFRGRMTTTINTYSALSPTPSSTTIVSSVRRTAVAAA